MPYFKNVLLFVAFLAAQGSEAAVEQWGVFCSEEKDRHGRNLSTRHIRDYHVSSCHVSPSPGLLEAAGGG